jgi:hypothetical protein
MRFILAISIDQYESIMLSQFDLSLRPTMQVLDVKTVAKQSSMTGALVLCQTLAGLEDKEICGKGGIINETATWSRIKGGSNNFPQDMLNKYMDVCENEAPLIWLADSRGYTLTPKETEWQRQSRIEREGRMKAEEENRLLRSLLIGRVTA